MKKNYINMNDENWIDEYDFLRDVIGIVKEEIKGNFLIAYVNKTDYEGATEKEV